jgi:hypothetical protein
MKEERDAKKSGNVKEMQDIFVSFEKRTEKPCSRLSIPRAKRTTVENKPL